MVFVICSFEGVKFLMDYLYIFGECIKEVILKLIIFFIVVLIICFGFLCLIFLIFICKMLFMYLC